MKPVRLLTILVGCLLLLPGVAVAIGGATLAGAHAFARDDDGFFETTVESLESPGVAVVSEEIDFLSEPGTPDWLINTLDTDVRLRASSIAAGPDLFLGIGNERDVDAYLAGVAHSEVTSVASDLDVQYRYLDGREAVAAPADQSFWEASAVGPGTQELTWAATPGRWVAVLMNADGSSAVAAEMDVGLASDAVLPFAVTLLAFGLAAAIIGLFLVLTGASGASEDVDAADRALVDPLVPTSPGALVPEPSPVMVSAQLDGELSRWQWLVKWILAIPHMLVLFVLWTAFVVLTAFAFVSILFTGRYPSKIFAFNVGVMRWSWRVSYYASHGGIGTDRYPPFSLADDPTYPARLDVRYPERLSRGLVLVKWWLLAIPHYLIVGLLLGGSLRWAAFEGDRVLFDPAGGGGVLGLLVLVAGVMLLINGRYPRALFDLIVGLNRWVYRVVAYAALMTDTYPPFRLDQGGDEPRSGPDDDPPVPNDSLSALSALGTGPEAF